MGENLSSRPASATTGERRKSIRRSAQRFASTVGEGRKSMAKKLAGRIEMRRWSRIG